MTRIRQAAMTDITWGSGLGRILGLAGLVALAAAGCSPGSQQTAGEGEQPMLLDDGDVAVVRRASVAERVTVSGDLEPYRVVTLSAQVPGSIRSIDVDRGNRVRSGQVLAVLEAEGIREGAAGAEAAVAAAEAALALARQQLESARTLHEAGALADLDLESARTAHEAARAQLAGARAQAAGALESARRATVSAPMDGVVSARMTEIGEAVNPGQPLFTVVDLRKLELRAQISVADASRVRAGMPVTFELDAYPGRVFSGTLDRVEPTADPDTRQVAVYARLPNPDQSMVGGLFARGWIMLGEAREAVTVPEDALRNGTVGPHVIAIQGGRVRTRPVTPGVRDPGERLVEIRQGLEPGDTVLIVPGASAPDGTPVEVTPTSAPLADMEN